MIALLLYRFFFLLPPVKLENHCGTLAFFKLREVVDLRQHVIVHLNFTKVTSAMASLDSQTKLIGATVGAAQIEAVNADQLQFENGDYKLVSTSKLISGHYLVIVENKRYDQAFNECGAAKAQLPSAPLALEEYAAMLKLLKQNGIEYQPFAVEIAADGIYDKASHQKIFHKDPVFTTDEIKNIVGITVATKKWAAFPSSGTGNYLCIIPKAERFNTPLSMEHFLAQVQLLAENVDLYRHFYEKFIKAINLPTSFSSEAYTLAPPRVISALRDKMEELTEKVNSDSVTFPLLETVIQINTGFTEFFYRYRHIGEKSIRYRLRLTEVAALSAKLNKQDSRIDTQVLIEHQLKDEYKVGYVDRAQLVQAKIYDILPYPDSTGKLVKDKVLVKIGENGYTTDSVFDFADCEVDEISPAQICSESPITQDRNYDCGAHVWSMRPAEESMTQCEYTWGESPFVVTETCGSNKAHAVTLVNPIASKIRIECPGEPTNPMKLPIGRFDLPDACQVMTEDKVIYKPSVSRPTFTKDDKDNMVDFYRQAKLALDATDMEWEDVLPYTLGGGVPSAAMIIGIIAWCMCKRRTIIDIEQGDDIYERAYEVPTYSQPSRFIYRSPLSLE